MSDSEFDQQLYLEKTGYLFDQIKTMPPGAQRAVLLALADEMKAHDEILGNYRDVIDFKINEEHPGFPLTVATPLRDPLAAEDKLTSAELVKAVPELFDQTMTPAMKLYFLCEVLAHLRKTIRPEGFQDDFGQLHWLFYFGFQSRIFAP